MSGGMDEGDNKVYREPRKPMKQKAVDRMLDDSFRQVFGMTPYDKNDNPLYGGKAVQQAMNDDESELGKLEELNSFNTDRATGTGKKFKDMGQSIGALVQEKNAAYGDSFAQCGDFLRLLYPDGLSPGQYDDALGLVRVFDKQKRIATNKDAFGESPWKDIAGYGILGAVRSEGEPKCRFDPEP